MADERFQKRSEIDTILQLSGRLRYLLMFTYEVDLSSISSIRVDGDNFKVDIDTPEGMLRFKAKGIDTVLRKDAESGIMRMEFDPALAQGIYNIVDEMV